MDQKRQIEANKYHKAEQKFQQGDSAVFVFLEHTEVQDGLSRQSLLQIDFSRDYSMGPAPDKKKA